MKQADRDLFNTIPERIFTVLASENKSKYWSVLCSLYKYKFGPDAPVPPAYGYYVTDIYRFIEDHIRYDEEWELEGNEINNPSINSRAISIFNRLNEAGWFSVEKHIMDKVVTMRPTVLSFLSTLINFAEKGPVFISGKIRSISNLVAQVLSGEASGDGLHEAAEQSRNLIQHIQNTSVNVRELIDSLNPKAPTSHYVKSLFEDYIEQYFIGDYKDLKTHDHPLSKRREVLESTDIIATSTEIMDSITTWYSNNLTKGNHEQALSIIKKDFSKLSELNRIEEFLDRLDDELRRANRKALAVLSYKVKSYKALDHLIKTAINTVTHSNLSETRTVFSVDSLMIGGRLSQPHSILKRSEPSPLRKKTVSLRAVALTKVNQRALDKRTINAVKLTNYVKNNLQNNKTISNEQLSTNTIEDIIAYQSLHTIAMAQGTDSPQLKIESKVLARTFDTRTTSRVESNHSHISGKNFLLERRENGKLTQEGNNND